MTSTATKAPVFASGVTRAFVVLVAGVGLVVCLFSHDCFRRCRGLAKRGSFCAIKVRFFSCAKNSARTMPPMPIGMARSSQWMVIPVLWKLGPFSAWTLVKVGAVIQLQIDQAHEYQAGGNGGEQLGFGLHGAGYEKEKGDGKVKHQQPVADVLPAALPNGSCTR